MKYNKLRNGFWTLLILASLFASLFPGLASAATKAATVKKAALIKKSTPVKKAALVKKAAKKHIKRASLNKKLAVLRRQPSYGQLAGLQSDGDPLALKSNVAFVMDQDTKEVLLSKNEHAVLPIASITKLMTGLLISEAHLPMDENHHHHPGRCGYRKAQFFAFGRWHPTQSRRIASSGADVQ